MPPTLNRNGEHNSPPVSSFNSLLEAALEQQGSRNSPLIGHKRKRQDEEDEEEDVQDERVGLLLYGGGGNKRLKGPEEEAAELAREREIWGAEEDDSKANRATVNARTSGLHSAAALFRKPTENSKKYTRQPLGKTFTSLEVSPELFLQLQAAAKAFMLDPNHPDRSASVGSRTKGDTDSTKLKLFACVKSFLEDEGWGERCWGEKSGTATSLKWPSMTTKIISLVTPLLRRMVTNERQRLYATKTRKDKVKSANKKSTTPELEDLAANISRNTTPLDVKQSSTPILKHPHIGPKLNQYHYKINPSFTSKEVGNSATGDNPTATMQAPAANGVHPANGVHLQNDVPSVNGTPPLRYYVNVFQDGTRIYPRVDLTPVSCPNFKSLVQHVQAILGEDGEIKSVIALTTSGLADVTSEGGWREVIENVGDNEWMDGEVRFVVEVGDRE